MKRAISRFVAPLKAIAFKWRPRASIEAKPPEFLAKYLDNEVLPGVTWDARLSSFVTRAIWNGIEIDVDISIEDDTEAEFVLALDTARQLWRNQEGWTNSMKDYAVSEFLELKNDTWVDEADRDRTLAPERFKKRLSLTGISIWIDSPAIDPDPHFEFFFDDDNMFFGHAIIVTGDLDKGPRSASLFG